jgi:predicted acylesterase/phospholipase RssA
MSTLRERGNEMPSDTPFKGKIVLCLSGGGFRATFFHLGMFRWLREHGLTEQISAVYSVSGGSILAAHLARNWNHLFGSPTDAEMLNRFNDSADKLVEFGGSDVRGRILRRWILFGIFFWIPEMFFRWHSGIKRKFSHFRITRLLAKEYARLFDQDWSLSELHSGAPEFNLLATSLSTGELCVLSQQGIRSIEPHNSLDTKARTMKNRPPTAATMVAASSAFPPMFEPVELTSVELGETINTMGVDPLYLTDGGVYDNVGIGLAMRDARDNATHDNVIFVVSDASAPFDWDAKASFRSLLSRTVRTTDILMKRVADFEDAICTRGAVDNLAQLSIDTVVPVNLQSGALSARVQSTLRNIRTDLDHFSLTEMGALASHGHAVAHAVLAKKFGASWDGA